MGKNNKKQPKTPLVSSVSTRIKQTVPENGVEVTTEEETKERKRKFLSILDKATDQFISNLDAGKVELLSSLDLERIVKLVLLVSGEADTIHGSTGSKETETTVGTEAKLAMSKIDEILKDENPAVQEIFKLLYDGYNTANDAECEQKG